MIQANELRIGNWFEFEGKYWRAVVITTNDAPEENPILLTPEILEKAGFIKGDIDFDYICEYFQLYEDNNGWRVGFDGNVINTSLKYLHQLQNLYHAVSGEELNISL